MWVLLKGSALCSCLHYCPLCMCVRDTHAALLLVELCKAESISRIVWPGKERPLDAPGWAPAAGQEGSLGPGGSAHTTSLKSLW